MSVVSELSMLELDAERGELLPEREPLSSLGVGKMTQTAADVADVSDSDGLTIVNQPIVQTQIAAPVNVDVDLGSAF